MANSKDKEHQRPLHLAQTPEVVAVLVDGGANPNAQDKKGRAPLHVAAAKGTPELVAAFIEKGAKLETKDEMGKTPGKDAKLGKLTYPSVAGIGTSRQRAETLIREAKVEMDVGGERTRLGALLDRMVDRRQ